jgi:alpha-galactosidase
MSLPTNIVVIGAGSASFGENTLAALVRSPRLRGSRLALVDHNPQSLDIVYRLARRLNEEWQAHMQISAHTHHAPALPGADFVISAIEVGPREELWRQDYEIPLRFGVRQPYAENGGPGGFAHAARNIGPLMKIVRDMEQACPQAWLINYTNPMMRICDAVNRHSRIRCVGLCHQIFAGYAMVGIALGNDLGFQVPEGISGMHSDVSQFPLVGQVTKQAVERIELGAAGLNHFSWVLSMHDRQSGEDLYPLFRERWAALSPDFEPLTRAVFEAFGIFPVPGDTHLAEYLPWMSNPVTQPWKKYNIHLYDWELFASLRDFSLDRLEHMADGVMGIESLLDTDSEGALEMVENIAGTGRHVHQAANLPNVGQIPNLPEGAIVETPVVVSAARIQPVFMDALPAGVAELCRREISAVQLCVDAAVNGDRQKALECLLLDPVISDMTQARQVLEAYLEAYRELLPQFWQ